MRTCIALVACLTALAGAQADQTQQQAQSLLAANTQTLAMLRLTYRDDEGQATAHEGLAVCIHAERQIFVTTAVDIRLPLSQFSEFALFRGTDPDRLQRAELMGVDLETGLAFVRALEGPAFQAVSFGPSEPPQIGQPVFSAGLLGRQGNYQPYVTVSRVAALVRLPGRFVMVGDAGFAMNAGPVFDAQGQMIGLTAAGGRAGNLFMTAAEFAHLLSDLPTGGAVRRTGWIGLAEVAPVTKEDAAIFNTSSQPAVRVTSLLPASPAETAGIRPMDIVLAVNGEPLERFAQPEMVVPALLGRLARLPIGQPVTLTVLRGGQRVEVPVPVAASPAAPTEQPRHYDVRLGVGVREPAMSERHALRLADGQAGLLVDAIRRTSPAANKLRGGDVLTHVNQRPVTDVKSFQAAMAGDAGPVTMRVLRGGREETVTLEAAGGRP